MASERGQATIEWTAVVLIVALAFATSVAVGVPHVDGRSYGGALARAILCALRGGCDDGRDALVSVYGERDAALVRRYAPSIVYEPGEREIPIDYRQCRTTKCGDAPDDRSLDVSRTDAGVPATAFTHVLRAGGRTFMQYWFYYPDSDSYFPGSHTGWKFVGRPLSKAAHGVWDRLPGVAHKLVHKLPGSKVLQQIPNGGRYPGFHHDDWEGYQVEIGPGGEVRVRATSHHGYQYCKQRQCENEWGPWTGWTRVSRGSHAGHIPLDTRLRGVSLAKGFPYLRGSYRIRRPAYPGIDLHERTTVGSDLRLVPLETMARGSTPNFDGISPPWRKPVYSDPLADST